MFQHVHASNEARRQDRESVKSASVCLQYNHQSLGNDTKPCERERE